MNGAFEDLERVKHPSITFKRTSYKTRNIRWRNEWIQLEHVVDDRSGELGVVAGLHNSKRSVLQEFVLAAREIYVKSTVSKVEVYFGDKIGPVFLSEVIHSENQNLIQSGTSSWVMTKTRRSFSTLILPEGAKEALLADAREFLDSEDWYSCTGMPHKRGMQIVRLLVCTHEIGSECAYRISAVRRAGYRKE